MSEIKVDTLNGKTSAGDITVTSEGGAAMQSLQQGLAKCWIFFNGFGTVSVNDSLNISGITDNATGSFTPAFSNSFSSVNYVPVCSPVNELGHSRGVSGLGVAINGDNTFMSMTTGETRLNHNYGSSASSNGGAQDAYGNFATFMGDLS